jgi:hypothetical protein
MGREATCICEWNGVAARVKALVEPPELILRGELKRSVPFAEMRQVSADGGRLRFKVGNDAVELELGETVAEKWKKAILTPPPTLAKKLGITPESTIWVIGKIDDEALARAVAEARATKRKGADIIVARVNTAAELNRAFKSVDDLTRAGVPIWIVYRKGPGHPVCEADVRSAGLAADIVDVKVAAVSSKLTGLKFVRRKNPNTK